MKKLVLLVFVMAVSIAANAAQPRVAVMNLENKTAYRGVENDLEGGVADMLVTALANTKKFRVIERSELEKVLKEQNLGATGAVNAQTAAKIGQILGVEYMVIGSVNQYGISSSDLGAFGVGLKSHTAEVGLDVRFIDTSSAEIAAAATGHGKKSAKAVKIENANILPTDVKVGSPQFNTSLIGKATREAVEDAVSKVSKTLGGSWKGVIAKVNDDGTVMINGGENADVKVNDVFKVIRKGEEVIDPQTGESLGSADKVIGEIKVTEVKPKYSIAKIIAGKDLQNSDKVEKK
jgi:curli biogenesis system outer membrane secretion channel CsgG